MGVNARDSIMTKNVPTIFQKDDNRTMLEGLDKEEDSLYNYDDQLSLAQKRKIDSLKPFLQDKTNIVKKEIHLLTITLIHFREKIKITKDLRKLSEC